MLEILISQAHLFWPHKLKSHQHNGAHWHCSRFQHKFQKPRQKMFADTRLEDPCLERISEHRTLNLFGGKRKYISTFFFSFFLSLSCHFFLISVLRSSFKIVSFRKETVDIVRNVLFAEVPSKQFIYLFRVGETWVNEKSPLLYMNAWSSHSIIEMLPPAKSASRGEVKGVVTTSDIRNVFIYLFSGDFKYFLLK